ncbi:aminoglycoside phosphotransferase family protein [Thalassovita sp.]|uniref:aminoglycoside phosphotransferase family protein n=1 Tax=Thalassovita sp. TaxID=1979401 RepID=UPI0029DE6434|nr:phosphotransferase [Thalassovita sp.]
MTDRTTLIDRFIAGTDWAEAKRTNLAGDASNRRYERLFMANQTAVLMDAPPEKGEDIRPFLRIARFLSGIGLSAPAILAEDPRNGFLLLEDLGDDLFARVAKDRPEMEYPLYEAATDTLVELHKVQPPELPAYSPEFMTEMAALAWDWYLRGVTGVDAMARSQFTAAFLPILQEYAADQTVLIQRDFHAENLLWLPDRNGIKRVGLLDFQDARTGHPAYDLVSLLKDARREVPDNLEREMITRYVQVTGANRYAFEAAYQVLGVQRNLRILGVFARLSMHFNKPHYVDLIPRVWDHLLNGLSHPALTPVSGLVQRLPAPDHRALQRLKDQAGCIPTL